MSDSQGFKDLVIKLLDYKIAIQQLKLARLKGEVSEEDYETRFNELRTGANESWRDLMNLWKKEGVNGELNDYKKAYIMYYCSKCRDYLWKKKTRIGLISPHESKNECPACKTPLRLIESDSERKSQFRVMIYSLRKGDVIKESIRKMIEDVPLAKVINDSVRKEGLTPMIYLPPHKEGRTYDLLVIDLDNIEYKDQQKIFSKLDNLVKNSKNVLGINGGMHYLQSYKHDKILKELINEGLVGAVRLPNGTTTSKASGEITELRLPMIYGELTNPKAQVSVMEYNNKLLANRRLFKGVDEVTSKNELFNELEKEFYFEHSLSIKGEGAIAHSKHTKELMVKLESDLKDWDMKVYKNKEDTITGKKVSGLALESVRGVGEVKRYTPLSDCPVAVTFEKDTKKFVGVQFDIEKSGDNGVKFINNLIKNIRQ